MVSVGARLVKLKGGHEENDGRVIPVPAYEPVLVAKKSSHFKISAENYVKLPSPLPIVGHGRGILTDDPMFPEIQAAVALAQPEHDFTDEEIARAAESVLDPDLLQLYLREYFVVEERTAYAYHQTPAIEPLSGAQVYECRSGPVPLTFNEVKQEWDEYRPSV